MTSRTEGGNLFEIPKGTKPPAWRSAIPSNRRFKPVPHSDHEYSGTLPDGRAVKIVTENDERYRGFRLRVLQRCLLTIDGVPVPITGMDVGPGPRIDPIYRIFHTPEGDFTCSIEDPGRMLRLL